MIADALSSRVETIFLRAVELPEEDRLSYVAGACDGDATMRANVEALLRGGTEALATTQLKHAFGLTLLTTTAEVLPIRLDRYDLEARVGEGSFGVVYRASQHTPVRRTVAVKVLRPGLDSDEIVRRFEAERQALAALDHPNIARLLDAGNTPDGRPYFVLELLDGSPLTEFCDAQRLGLRERLALFLEVCAGVEHAHRRAILHRDLKPSNILVTRANEDDNAPRQVKVIDFGIARALGDTQESRPFMTDPSRPLGTPEYMSPEQICGEQGRVDTRSDVYALGVILYQLLSGRLPFESRQLRSASAAEMRRIVCEVEPPSNWSNDEAAWIAMRALRKDPRERYRGVAELADDVRNYLAERPLLAGPESRIYRLRKFVRRHRPTLAIAATVLVIATMGIGFYLHSIRSEQARTRIALDDAEATVQFLNDMLASVEPARAQGRAVLVQDMLDRAATTVGEQFADKPSIERRLRLTVGQTYQALGKPEIAAVHLKRASDLANADTSANVKDRFEAAVELARALKDLARTNEVEASLRSLVRHGHESAIPRSLVLDAQALLGAACLEQGKWPEAEEILGSVLRERRGAAESNAVGLITALTDYGNVLAERGRPREAEASLKAASDLAAQSLGQTHPQTLAARAGYGSVLVTLARFREAEPILHDTLEHARLVWGLDHHETLNVLVNYATALECLGNTAEAEKLYREAVDRHSAHLGGDHPLSLQYLDLYAGVLESLGRVPEALRLAERVLEQRTKTQGPDHPYTLASVSRVGWLKLSENAPEGIELLKSGYERAVLVLGKEHPITLGLMNNYAVSLGKTDPARGEQLLVELIALRERTRGPDHPDTIGTIGNLGNLLGDYRRNDESLRLVADALQRQQRAFGPDHPWVLTAMNNYALQLNYVGRFAEAEPIARDCVQRRLRVLGEQHPSTSTAMNNHALILDNMNRLSEAEEAYRRSMELRIKYTGIDSSNTTNSQHNLALFLIRQGRLSEAEPLSRAAYETSLRKLGPDNKDTRVFARYYARLLEEKLGRRDDAVAVRLSAGLPPDNNTTQPVTGPPPP